MARIAFLSEDETVMPAAYRVKSEGHQVLLWIKDQDAKTQRVGRGLVLRPSSLQEVIDAHPAVVVAYQTCEEAAQCARAGLRTWGCSEDSLAMERDRMAGINLAKTYGLGTVPETHEFTSVNQALAFVDQANKEQWVLKCSGKVATSTTQVCEDRKQLRELLRSAGPKAETFVLQEKVEGVEVSTEGWYDYRQGWIPGSLNSTLERKRLMVGDVGPMTGAMGSIVFPWPGKTPRLFSEVLEPITPYLRQIKYTGPLDVNSIVTPQGPYFLEFTPRLGWDAFCAFMVGYSGSVGDFLVALGRGDSDAVGFATDFMGAVRVTIPESPNVPLMAPWKQSPRNYMVGAVYHDGKLLRSTGLDTDAHLTTIFEVGAIGDSIAEVRNHIYKRFIPKIMVPDITYRDDIGEQADRDIYALASLGYEVPLPAAVDIAMPTPYLMGAPPIRSARG